MAAVSARKIRGPRLIEKVFGCLKKRFFSFFENPPSGPIKIAQAPFGSLDNFPTGFKLSSLQKNMLRLSGHFSNVLVNLQILWTLGT